MHWAIRVCVRTCESRIGSIDGASRDRAAKANCTEIDAAQQNDETKFHANGMHQNMFQRGIIQICIACAIFAFLRSDFFPPADCFMCTLEILIESTHLMQCARFACVAISIL